MYKDDNELVPCEFLPNFFKVPGKKASVSRDGSLLLHENKKVYDASMYGVLVAENKNYAYAGKYSIHTCVAETFLKLPEGSRREDVIVNHKDGIKSNNAYSNLEWTSYSGNITHAYESGLRTDNVRLKARNIETGEVLYFLSIGQCARYFKVNNNRVFGYINRKIKEAAFLNSHVLVRDHEEFPSQEESKGWRVSDNRTSVIVFCQETKKATIYQTTVDASRALGLSKGTVSMALLRAKKNNTYVAEIVGRTIVPIEYGQDYMKFVQEDLRRNTWERNFKPPKRTKPRVVMTDIKSGDKTEFENIYKMAEHFKLRHETIMKTQKANGGVFQGFRIELI